MDASQSKYDLTELRLCGLQQMCIYSSKLCKMCVSKLKPCFMEFWNDDWNRQAKINQFQKKETCQYMNLKI